MNKTTFILFFSTFCCYTIYINTLKYSKERKLQLNSALFRFFLMSFFNKWTNSVMNWEKEHFILKILKFSFKVLKKWIWRRLEMKFKVSKYSVFNTTYPISTHNHHQEYTSDFVNISGKPFHQSLVLCLCLL